MQLFRAFREFLSWKEMLMDIMVFLNLYLFNLLFKVQSNILSFFIKTFSKAGIIKNVDLLDLCGKP